MRKSKPSAKPRRPPEHRRTKHYLLPLTPAEDAELKALADEVGATMADAFRYGALEWLLERKFDKDEAP